MEAEQRGPRGTHVPPDDLADAVVHVMDQPWGINLSDVTVRASGEDYIR